MRGTTRQVVIAGAAALMLVVGAGAAYAATNGNDDLKRAAGKLASMSQFQADVAKRLGTTVPELDAAHEAAALKRIDAAQKAGDITADEASTLKSAVGKGRLAKRLALPADVAKELGTTEEKLSEAYSEARKAQMKARVDRAVADGQITKEYGEELKQRIDEADLSGPGKRGFGHGGFRKGGFGKGGIGKHGFGPPPQSAPAAGAAPATLVF